MLSRLIPRKYTGGRKRRIILICNKEHRLGGDPELEEHFKSKVFMTLHPTEKFDLNIG